jgi:hypothetical protein
MVTLKSLSAALLLLLVTQSRPVLSKDFTDSDLEKALRQESRVLFYSFSASMPLSISGLTEIKNAATDLRAQVVFLLDPLTTSDELGSLSIAPEILSSIRLQKSERLRDLGAQLHYPSLVVSGDHRIVGAPIPGFKSRAGYVTLVTERLKLPWTETFRVSSSRELPRPISSVFFRPLYGTDFVILGYGIPASYLLNVKTHGMRDISDGGDAAATPDGEFITFISVVGLSWFSVRDIMAGKPQLVFHDEGLRTYQSMALLPGSSTYRVLGAESSSTAPTGLRFRDYEPKPREDGGKTVSPLNGWQSVCTEKRISIPMMSKTGQYLSGLEESTLKVFRIGLDGKQCEAVFDSKAVTGKADFSVDDRSLVYVSRTEDPASKVSVDAVFLADLTSHQVKPIYYALGGSQLFFPGFLNPDEIVVYDQTLRTMTLIERTRAVD